MAISKSWSLVGFAREHGKLQIGDFVNGETGEPFKSCIFTNQEGKRTFASFSSKMGELSPETISRDKESLQVVQLESGNYSLCKKGTNSWVDVDLGI